MAIPVALQLHGVRDKLQKDVEKTLLDVKRVGYDYVETAGLFGLDYSEFAAGLEAAGLRAVCAHVPLSEFLSDIGELLSGYRRLGCEYIAIPWVGEDMQPQSGKFDGFVELAQKIGAECAAFGMPLLYHNHDFEFEKMPNGEYALDYLYRKTDAGNLGAELDTCWVRVGGEDPSEYLRKYSGRCPIVHLKDYAGGKSKNMYELIGSESAHENKDGEFKFRPLGHGVQDIPSILKASEECGVRYLVVEQDDPEERDSMDAAAISREYLKSLGY